MKNRCSVPGCDAQSHHDKPLCFPHWLAAPERCRLRISAGTRPLQGNGRGVAYQRALAEAIASIITRG